MLRRSFLGLVAGFLAWRTGVAPAAGRAADLRDAPLELTGDWGESPPPAAEVVIARMRQVSLAGVRLLSDQQPDSVRVQSNRTGPPAIWLHDDRSRTAWIVVDIGGRDWCKLAYQFGHELGHVLANSWGPQAKPQPPCQWLEEALVEAFSIRGLGLLAESWETNPPFAGDAPFAQAIRQYRTGVIAGYTKADDPTSDAAFSTWFPGMRGALEASGGLNPIQGPVIRQILAQLERDRTARQVARLQ